MSETTDRYEPYFVELTYEQEGKLRTVCTDDRAMKSIRFAIQFASGSKGMAQAAHSARVINGEAPVRTDLSLDARKASALVSGSSHVGCAALISAALLDGNAKNKPAEVLEQTDKLIPGLVTERDMELYAHAAEFRLENGMHVPVERSLEVMGDVSLGIGAPVPHLDLHHDADHAGDVMIANDVEGSYFDTQRAFSEGNAAYGFTVHRMGRIGMRLESLFPGVSQNHAFLKASAIHHANVSLAVPNSTGATGVVPVYRAAHFAKVA